MRNLILVFTSLCLLASCNTNSKRFVSNKTSKEAVNTKGSAYDEHITRKRIDYDTLADRNRNKINFMGASGPGTGRSYGSLYSMQERLKRTPEDIEKLNEEEADYFSESEEAEELDAENVGTEETPAEADTLSGDHDETYDWPEENESTDHSFEEEEEEEWEDADWDSEDWDWD
ncbi:hypothetical protein RCC89_20130 [Cytophagaceae bacterium ABcell3]|nr:hypothetical protein RCC89_20130 [Cytophagaceae bacterium ABcell3]